MFKWPRRARLLPCIVVTLVATVLFPLQLASQHVGLGSFLGYLALAGSLLSTGDLLSHLVIVDDAYGIVFHTTLRLLALSLPASLLFWLAKVLV